MPPRARAARSARTRRTCPPPAALLGLWNRGEPGGQPVYFALIIAIDVRAIRGDLCQRVPPWAKTGGRHSFPLFPAMEQYGPLLARAALRARALHGARDRRVRGDRRIECAEAGRHLRQP